MADESTQSNPEKKAAHRSPNYPAFDLGTAIARIRTVYDKDKRTPTTPEVIARHMGYTQTNGPGGRALSCMRQFGLLEDFSGKLRVSESAFSLLHLPEEDKNKAKLMREAALRPTLYRALFEDYPDGIPSDATLTSTLLGRKFNPPSIEGVISDFRLTMEVAKVYDVSGIGGEDESKMQTLPPTPPGNPPPNSGGKPLVPADPLTTKTYAYGFEGSGFATLTIMGPYTADDLDDLDASIQTSLKTLRRSVKKETVQ
jgi:hypothetical protein